MSERQAKVQALHDVLKSELGEGVASKFTAADVGVLVDAGFNDAQDLRDAVEADELQQLQGLPGARRANLKAHYQGGGGSVGSRLTQEMSELRAQVNGLRVEVNRASTTTKKEVEIGETFLPAASLVHVNTLFHQASLPELSNGQIHKVLLEVNSAFQRTSSRCKTVQALEDAAQCVLEQAASERSSSSQPQLKEEHMQPVAFRLISKVAAAVTHAPACLFVRDTHRAGVRPGAQQGLIDCSVMAEGGEPLWPYVYIATLEQEAEVEAHAQQLALQEVRKLQVAWDRWLSQQLATALAQPLPRGWVPYTPTGTAEARGFLDTRTGAVHAHHPAELQLRVFAGDQYQAASHQLQARLAGLQQQVEAHKAAAARARAALLHDMHAALVERGTSP